MCSLNLLKYSEFKFKRSLCLLLALLPCVDVRSAPPSFGLPGLAVVNGSFQLPVGTAVNITSSFSADCKDEGATTENQTTSGLIFLFFFKENSPSVFGGNALNMNLKFQPGRS